MVGDVDCPGCQKLVRSKSRRHLRIVLVGSGRRDGRILSAECVAGDRRMPYYCKLVEIVGLNVFLFVGEYSFTPRCFRLIAAFSRLFTLRYHTFYYVVVSRGNGL